MIWVLSTAKIKKQRQPVGAGVTAQQPGPGNKPTLTAAAFPMCLGEHGEERPIHYETGFLRTWMDVYGETAMQTQAKKGKEAWPSGTLVSKIFFVCGNQINAKGFMG